MSIEVHRVSWQGRADGVAVKTFMPRFPHHVPMSVTGEGWEANLYLPADARIEYRIEIRRGHRYESTLDPANSEVATNPFGENSVLRGTAYPASPPQSPSIEWNHREFRVPSSVSGVRRHHHLLSPGGVPDRDDLPLLLLHDGSDYRNHASLEGVLGAAISAGELPALRVVLLEPRLRNTEYAANPQHAVHLADEVLPVLERRIGIGPERVLGGASLGAVASWHAAWSQPGVFTGLVLQSGTFAFSSRSELPPTMARPIRAFLDSAMRDPRVEGIGIGQTCGRYESLIDWNRTVASRLGAETGSLRYEERWAGHDWGAWSDTLVASLTAALQR